MTEEKANNKQADERTAGCGFADPQIVWLAKHGFRPDREGGWLLRCGSGYWWDTVGTFVRCSQDGEGPSAPWTASLEPRPDDPWISCGGRSLTLSYGSGRTPEIAVRGCLDQGAERARRLRETDYSGRALARVLYALAMADVRDTLPDLVGEARPPRKEDDGGLKVVGGSLRGQVTGAEEPGLKERKAARWLDAHGFVPSKCLDGAPCWYRTCGGVPGVPEDGIEARLVTWRNSAGAWAADATVLLSGSRSAQCGMTSVVVSGGISLPDEGPDVALSECVGSMALLEHSDEPKGFAEIARIAVGRYKKAITEIEAKPASAG